MEYLVFILISLITWIGGFSLHEYFHKWEAQKQGVNAHILVWFHYGIPSLCCVPDGKLVDRRRFLLAGGLGSGAVLLLLSLIFLSYWYIFVPVFTVGLINLIYSFYEMNYRDVLQLKDYMKYHYLLYLIVGLFSLVFCYFFYNL